MGKYALIVEPDAGRAAQYGYRLERKGLTPALTKSAAEAFFEVSRAGVPGVILVEARLPDGDGLNLLGGLRKGVPAEAARAIVIVSSREEHEAAARLMIQLGICALLPHSHTMAALDRAIDAALQDGPVPNPPPAPADLAPEAGADAAIPEHLASHPLVLRLSESPGLRALSAEGLQELAGFTARTFGTPIAMLWLSFAGRSLLEVHVNAAVPATSPLREPSRWSRVRAMIGASPVYLPDVRDTPVFSGADPAHSRLPASLAGAPLTVGGVVAGGVLVLQPHVVGRLDEDVLEPLTFWAQRLSGDLERLAPPPSRDVAAPAPAPSVVSRTAVLESLAGALEAGLLVSDASGSVCFANEAFLRLLHVSAARVAGQPRALLLRHLSTNRGAADGVVSAIVGARQSTFSETSFVAAQPERRVLRWRGRAIVLGDGQGHLDELTDITAEAGFAERREALVRIDAFTGLANRPAIDDALGREISRALRTGVPFSIALFAIDRLRLGDESAPGEETFRKVAWLLRSTARGHDLAARLDRLRLIAILSETTGEQALAFCGRFIAEVRKMAQAGPPPVTVSGGVAQFDGDRTFPELLRDATAKLAEARRLGGDRVL